MRSLTRAVALAALALALALALTTLDARRADAADIDAQVRAAVKAKRYPEAIKLLTRGLKVKRTAWRLKALADVYNWTSRGQLAVKYYRRYLKLKPKDDKTHLQLGTVLSWSKKRADLLAAIKIFNHHITFNPGRLDLKLRRARVRYWVGQRAGAIADFEAYLEKNPADVKVKSELATCLTELANLNSVQRGVKLLSEYIKVKPGDANARLRRARAYIRLKRIGPALEDYAKYIELNPTDQKVRNEMANSLSRVRDSKALKIALSVYNDRIRKNANDTNATLQRCRVYTLLGETKKAFADARSYVALAGRTMKAQLTIATILSWSKKKASLKFALRLFKSYLDNKPKDWPVWLQRARVLSWYGDLPGAIRSYQRYISNKADDKALLELANVLTWTGTKASLGRAALYLARYLKSHPGDLDIRGKHGRLMYRLGRYKAAIDELKAYMKERPDDADHCLLLGRALAESGNLNAATSVLDLLLKKKSTQEAELLRAQVMRLRGDHARAEGTLERIVGTAKKKELRRFARAELAKLYAATGRRVRGIELAQQLVNEKPKDPDARRLYRRLLAGGDQPHVATRFFAYSDSQDNVIVMLGVRAQAGVHPRMTLFADASLWRLEHTRESLWTQRVDFGVKVRPTTSIEIIGAIGPRTYQVYDAELGARLSIRYRPLAWLEFGAAYIYDDIYQMFFQPGSLSARARGHTCKTSLRLDLPFRITAQGEALLRDILPDNTGLDLRGGVTIPVFSVFSVGYYGRWLHWSDNNASYWSPTYFNLHAGLIRAQKELPKVGLSIAAQAAVGIATERIEGVAETGIELAASGRVDVSYRPLKWLTLRAGVDLGYWPRLRVVGLQGGTASPDAQSLRVKTSDTFLWIAPTASVTLNL